MTKEQTHKALYIVAFFALCAFTCNMLTIHISYWFIKGALLLMCGAILFTAYQVVLIFSPVFKCNKVLFLVPISAYFVLPSHLSGLLAYWFTNYTSFAKVGVVPGIYIAASISFTDISGLIILALRIYGYWREHKGGQKTKF